MDGASYPSSPLWPGAITLRERASVSTETRGVEFSQFRTLGWSSQTAGWFQIWRHSWAIGWASLVCFASNQTSLIRQAIRECGSDPSGTSWPVPVHKRRGL